VPGGDPGAQAVHELAEETGLLVAPERLRESQVRQAVATLSAHRVHVFRVELSEAEIAWAKANPGPHGVAADSERTFVEVCTYGEILDNGHTDWVTLGVLAAVFTAP
jgi:hypothetical protein